MSGHDASMSSHAGNDRSGALRLYETVHTLYPEVLDHITKAVEPFCHAEGMTFSNSKFSHGPWKGYLVGAVGDVAASEDDALWPNRVSLDSLALGCSFDQLDCYVALGFICT